MTLAQRAYEAMVILNPNVGEDDLKAASQRISDQITTRGGQVDKVETWGRRRMFYPIKHTMDGHYVVYSFHSEPQALREMEANWRITDDILRHLITSKEG
jgi:small subunit ribosomal protein S6